MNKPIRAHERDRQILRALHRHGPVTIYALKHLLVPPIRTQPLTAALKRLKRLGWITYRQSGHYFPQINQRGHYWSKIASEIDVPAHTLKQPWARYFRLHLEDYSAVWCEYLTRHFPKAQILHRWEVAADPQLKERFFRRYFQGLNGPNLLIRFPEENGKRPINIFVRVEADHFNSRRILKTMNADVATAHADAVLWLYPSGTLRTRLRILRTSRYLQRLIKKKQLREKAFVLCDIEDLGRSLDSQLYWLKDENINLGAWINMLRTYESERSGSGGESH